MTKVTLNDLTNLNNQQSSINTINGNNTTIETAFDNTLSRDGTSPNTMESTLDMNSNHIINLPEPAGQDEPLRLQDITNFIDQFALVQTPSPGDAGKIIRVRADEIAYDISSTIVDATSNNVYPVTNDVGSLGTSSNKWSDLFLALGAVINFNSGDVTITHANNSLAFSGGTYTFDNKIYPTANDGAALGDTTHSFSDLFLASGAVINYNSDITITHSADLLSFAGGKYTFDGELYPTTNDGAPLGDTTHNWSDLFLASGAIINFNNGEVTLTHSINNLAFAGGTYTFDGKIYPTSNDGAALGDATHNFSDLFLASGAVVNFNNSDITVTHSADLLSFAGGKYTFDGELYPTTDDGAPLGDSTHNWSDLFLASGAVINFNASDVTITHSSDNLAFAGGTYTFDNKIYPTTNDGAALGDLTHNFSDLFLASGAVVNFNNSDVTITHSADNLAFAGGTYQFDNKIYPTSNDGAPLGDTTHNWSDLFLASGAVINFNAGDVTITHVADKLYFAGGTNGYFFDATVAPTTNDAGALGTGTLSFSDLFLASGGVINFNNGDVTITHSTDSLAFNGASGSGYHFDNWITLAGSNVGITIINSAASNCDHTIQANNGTLVYNADVNNETTGVAHDFRIKNTSYVTINNSAIFPTTNDLIPCGWPTLAWSDLYLASGAVINFNNGDIKLTHSSGRLTLDRSLTVQEAIEFSNWITPSLSADTNDWAPTGYLTATSFLVSATGGWNVTGIAGGTNGRILLVFNVDVANTFTIKANNGSSLPENRIQCGTDLNLAPGTGCLLYYETNGSFWRLIGGGSGGGGVSNAYGSMTDGTTIANASGSDTFTFRTGTGLKVTVGSNDPTYGDNLLTEYDINSATQDTAPDRQADYAITYDASATTHKKVLLKDLTYPQCTVQIFTSSGTWTRPTGCKRIKATIQGGGGGGGSSTSSTSGRAGGGGGGAGATCYTYLDVTDISTLPVTVGVGGSSTNDGGTSGLGTSNAYGQCTGGKGGNAPGTGALTIGGSGGGTASNGTININGQGFTNPYFITSSSAQGCGGASSLLGNGGDPLINTNSAGNAATGYGAGGSGGFRTAGTTIYGGGAGSPGIVIIEQYF